MRQTTATAELELADRARAGDQGALIQLYRKHRDAIHRHARRMLGDDAAAQDVVQEAFARAIEAIDRTRPQLKFKAWIFRIATNLCLRELNRNNRWSPPRTEHFDFDRFEQPRKDVDPRAALHRRELGKLVEQALSRLPERYRQILLLREVEELSYEELGQVLEMSEGNVKVTLHRARARFAALFVADRLLAEPGELEVACGQLDALVQGGVDQDQVERHLETCVECRKKQRPQAELFAMLPPVVPASPLPDAPRPQASTSSAASGTGSPGLAGGGLSSAAMWSIGLAAGILVLGGIAIAASTLLGDPLQATEQSSALTSSAARERPRSQEPSTPARGGTVASANAGDEQTSPSTSETTAATETTETTDPSGPVPSTRGPHRATPPATESPGRERIKAGRSSRTRARTPTSSASKNVRIQATDDEDPPLAPPVP
jgi:RNA polymerase sigma-70 factor (ECF subfamily)